MQPQAFVQPDLHELHIMLLIDSIMCPPEFFFMIPSAKRGNGLLR
jgi:hypothetical protein